VKTRVKYEDFALKIHPLANGETELRVLGAPYGARDTRFRLPFPEHDLPGVIGQMELAIRSSSPASARKARDLFETRQDHTPESVVPALSPEDLGAGLFKALFRDTVADSFLLSRGRVEATPDVGLRLRLVFDPERPGTAALLGLPWELLYQPEAREFLARGLFTPVVRYLEVPRARIALPLGSSMRVLVVVAAPRDLPSLDVEAECQRLKQIWKERQDVQVEILPHATAEAVHQALRHQPFEAFHFAGHGAFGGDCGEGVLLFESAHGDSHPVSGPILAETLRTNRTMRLAFLNGCDTARIPRHHGQDPFTSVASALVAGGLPAVLAMQFPISDRAAKVFSETFYSALAAGDPADAATSEGRLAIHRDMPNSWEWATPVLFLSVSDGQIFKSDSKAQPSTHKHKEEPIMTPSKPGRSGSTYQGDFAGSDFSVHGDFHFSKSPTADEQAQQAYDLGLRYLGMRSYGQAEKTLRSALECAEVDSEAFYYLALSILGGERPRVLHLSEIREIESLLGSALRQRPRRVHHLFLLALVRHDYYTTNGMDAPEPRPRLLLQKAKDCKLEAGKIHELLDHLPDMGGPVYSEIQSLVSQSPKTQT